MLFLKKNSVTPEEINFKKLVLPDTPTYCLLVPDGFASSLSSPASPVFNCSVETLEAAWKEVIKREPRVKLRSRSDKMHRYHYIQTSFLFHLPSFIIVQLISLSETQSTIAILSYSVYGYLDLGSNRARVYRWLIKLKKYLINNQLED